MYVPTQWDSPPNVCELKANEIHVWLVEMDLLAADHAKHLEWTLSADERRRAQRLRFDCDRQHFIMARAILRVILSSYLEHRPDCLTFSYGPYGKPTLAGPHSELALNFNVSHSIGRVVIAVSRHEVGVDIERLRDLPDADRIAEAFFSKGERQYLHTMPVHNKNTAFFTCWTRKEAYVKALGKGLSMPLDQFAVSPVSGEPARVMNVLGAPQEATRWAVWDLPPILGYAAALAADSDSLDLACWQCTTEAMRCFELYST